MQSNTKLTYEQKALLRVLRERQNGPNFAVLQTQDKTVTVAVQYTPGHNCAQIAVSIASPDEKKARRKVGEYLARIALNEGAYIPYLVGDDRWVGKDAEYVAREFIEVCFGEFHPVTL